ncbi:MAG: hypothetical protein QXK89_04245 [Candidatus Bathyarchaeia archaeon]
MKEVSPQYKSSRWVNSAGETISKSFVYENVFVEVIVENPLRKQSAIGLVKVAICRDSKFILDIAVKQSKHIVTIPPLSTEKILIPFKPLQESEYYYKIFIEGKEVYTQPKDSPPRLHVSRRECILIIDEVDGDSKNPGLTVTGKLIDAATGEGIEGARIGIYDERTLRGDELLAYGVTLKDGSFNVDGLRAFKIGSKLKVYAKFLGDDLYKPSVSNCYTINFSRT